MNTYLTLFKLIQIATKKTGRGFLSVFLYICNIGVTPALLPLAGITHCSAKGLGGT